MVDVIADPMSVIAREMDRIRDGFIAEVFEEIKAENRDLNYDAAMLELWRASLTDSVVAGIEFLAKGAPPEWFQAPAASVAYVRAAARRDVPLSVLVRAHRIVYARFLEAATRFVALVEPVRQVPTIVDLVSRSASFVDAVADQLTVSYELERDECLGDGGGRQPLSDEQARDNVPVAAQVADSVLTYPLHGVHIAAALWVDELVPALDVVSSFDRVRRAVAAAVGAVNGTLLVPTHQREARLWFALDGSGKPEIDQFRVRTAFESAGVRAGLAFGRVEEGQSGFRASLKQAERVKAVAFAGRGRSDARVIFYSEIAPIALMAGDLDELRSFVIDVLGDLGHDDERCGWLRETLREFLSRNRNHVVTAEVMRLPPNIIQEAVTRAMQLCGHSLGDPDAMLQVQIALEACRWMAPALLHMAHECP
ncbi:helix-turn-helix domain-containing protein [Mycobacterium lentiflavum]|uniref:Helix-turn-helix domain-containing protein n=1 Tax=Mycobacterium lentiflavum TaxID=141349 RepID=A0ABY3V4L6_MYCLN|nr:helix-turn-helix domain-containing protein [Mycobacterium lentiflavum]ULP44442.1 helix-turn-helix domain-containing protein [Mycobacterium lentiflavum]